LYPKQPTDLNHWLAQPPLKVGINSENAWRVLLRLPTETVVAAYITFDHLNEAKDVINEMKTVDVTWTAIDTRTEDKMLSADGNIVSPIGYPVQPDQTYWSPFRNAPAHEETFLQM